jgi:hypothetical protein
MGLQLTLDLSGERLGNGTMLAPDHSDFSPRNAPSPARPLQRVLGSIIPVGLELVEQYLEGFASQRRMHLQST